MASGEFKLASSDLKAVFGRLGVQLLDDDGRLLGLTFSSGSDAAHIDVTGDLPDMPADHDRPHPPAKV
jgi:hypothetical protein